MSSSIGSEYVYIRMYLKGKLCIVKEKESIEKYDGMFPYILDQLKAFSYNFGHTYVYVRTLMNDNELSFNQPIKTAYHFYVHICTHNM